MSEFVHDLSKFSASYDAATSELVLTRSFDNQHHWLYKTSLNLVDKINMKGHIVEFLYEDKLIFKNILNNPIIPSESIDENSIQITKRHFHVTHASFVNMELILKFHVVSHFHSFLIKHNDQLAEKIMFALLIHNRQIVGVNLHVEELDSVDVIATQLGSHTNESAQIIPKHVLFYDTTDNFKLKQKFEDGTVVDQLLPWIEFHSENPFSIPEHRQRVLIYLHSSATEIGVKNVRVGTYMKHMETVAGSFKSVWIGDNGEMWYDKSIRGWMPEPTFN